MEFMPGLNTRSRKPVIAILILVLGLVAQIDIAQSALKAEDMGLDISTCFGCAEGTNKMCLPDALALPDQASVVCCKEGTPAQSTDGTDPAATTGGNMDKSYCQASDGNKCSASFASSP